MINQDHPPRWIVAVSGVDQRGYFFHSGYATCPAAEGARVEVQRREERAFLDHNNDHSDISSPVVEVACWPHQTALEPGEQVDIRDGFAHPYSPLDYAPDHSCVLHQSDRAQQYRAVAVISYDHLDALNLLAAQKWPGCLGVTLLVDSPRRTIEMGDVIETSSGLTFAHDGHQFRAIHPSVLNEGFFPKPTPHDELAVNSQGIQIHDAMQIKPRR